jgi:hypothetical protein
MGGRRCSTAFEFFVVHTAAYSPSEPTIAAATLGPPAWMTVRVTVGW